MKTSSLGAALLVLVAWQTNGQSSNQAEMARKATLANLPAEIAYQVTERGPHHRVWPAHAGSTKTLTYHFPFTSPDSRFTLCRVMLTLNHLAGLLEQNRAATSARVREFAIGGRSFAFDSRPAIMGVLNLSADSWYREIFAPRL